MNWLNIVNFASVRISKLKLKDGYWIVDRLAENDAFHFRFYPNFHIQFDQT